MDLKKVKSKPVNGVARRRVGRGTGSGLGKTCGRGHKGQKSRSGWSKRGYFEGGQMPLFRRLPKKGFTRGRFEEEYAVINVKDLSRFDGGASVTPDSVTEKGLVKNIRDGLVILGKGELSVALTVRAHKVSAAAAAKITAAGGTVELITRPKYNPRRQKK